MRRVKGIRRATFANRSGRAWLAAAAATPLALWAIPSFGQTLTWDASGSTPPLPVDRSGNWNTTTHANWTDGANTFTGSVFLNRGTVVIGAGGTLGDSSNAVALGQSGSATSVGAINFSAGASVTSGSFSATTNTTQANTMAIGSAATFNVNSNV